MGKQVSKDLRFKAKKLYELFPDKFSESFEANKKALAELKIPFSKLNANMVAGLLVKLAEKEKA